MKEFFKNLGQAFGGVKALFGPAAGMFRFLLLIILGIYVCIKIPLLNSLMHFLLDKPFELIWYIFIGDIGWFELKTPLKAIKPILLGIIYLIYYYCLALLLLKLVFSIFTAICRTIERKARAMGKKHAAFVIRNLRRGCAYGAEKLGAPRLAEWFLNENEIKDMQFRRAEAVRHALRQTIELLEQAEIQQIALLGEGKEQGHMPVSSAPSV